MALRARSKKTKRELTLRSMSDSARAKASMRVETLRCEMKGAKLRVKVVSGSLR